MTKKHFKAAAMIVAAKRIPGFVETSVGERILLAQAFATFFQSEVPKFNKETFFKECGIEDGVL
jgi:hypothetical protein